MRDRFSKIRRKRIAFAKVLSKCNVAMQTRSLASPVPEGDDGGGAYAPDFCSAKALDAFASACLLGVSPQHAERASVAGRDFELCSCSDWIEKRSQNKRTKIALSSLHSFFVLFEYIINSHIHPKAELANL